jgi:dTDP-4-amino-4,6-dideoxygalactose transaminase
MRGPFAPGNHSATDIQALILNSQMDRLDDIMDRRREAAVALNERFASVDGLTGTPMGEGDTRSTHHLYLLKVDPDVIGGDIQDLKAKLKERGVTQIQHFAPLYKFSIMDQLGYDTDAIQESCPVTEDLFNRRFTHLPLYPLSEEQVTFMGDAVVESIEEISAGR